VFCCVAEGIKFILRDVFHVHVKFTQRSGGNDLTEEFFGSVLYLYKELYERLTLLFKRRIGSPDFRDEAGGGKVFFEYPEIAIVEALVNFLIHRDYSLDDLGFITIYPDRVEFMNPGRSIFPVDELLSTTSPLRPRYQRNPRLIEAMNKARLNQREGGGILRIRKELENNRSYLPNGSLGLTLENDEVNNRFSLTIYKRVYLEDTALSNYPKQDDGIGKTSSASIRTSGLIPRPPIIGFITRKDVEGRDIVERLKEELAPGKNQLITLSGPGGVGKTTLAAEAARSLVKTYQGRFVWSDVAARASFTLSTLLDDIATQLGQPDLRILKPEDKETQVRALVADAPALVVLDNYETIASDEQRSIEAWFAHTNCPALITSRPRITATLNIVISAMSPDEAEEFLNRLAKKTQDPQILSSDVRQRIYKTAEANPFVMEWIVAQIDKAQEPDMVLEELKHGKGDAAQRVFDRSFNLTQLGDDGRDTLLALSLFTPSATREALAAVAGFGDDLKRVNEAISSLRALWLIKGIDQNRRLTIEGLTRTLAAARLSKENRVEFKERFIAHFLSYAEAHAQKTSEDFDALEAEKDNVLNALDAAYRMEDWLRVMRIRAALQGFLDLRGYWDEAIQHGEQALQAARNAQTDEGVARFAHNVAVKYQDRGDLAKARRLYDESLEIEKKLGNQSGIAITLHQLATLAQDQGEIEEARRLYDESLEIKKRLGNQSGIAITLHQLGNVAYLQGEIEEARRLYDESLEIEKKLGNQSGIAITLHQLGMLAEDRGELAEAERLFREALSIFERLGSPDASIARRSLERIRGES
jgi:tetratricopeptide (TPR) repeat protein